MKNNKKANDAGVHTKVIVIHDANLNGVLSKRFGIKFKGPIRYTYVEFDPSEVDWPDESEFTWGVPYEAPLSEVFVLSKKNSKVVLEFEKKRDAIIEERIEARNKLVNDKAESVL